MARLPFGESAEGREARALPVPAACERANRAVPKARRSKAKASGLLDVKNNVGEAETYLASPGGADDPPQFVCAFQRLRIGFV